MCFRIVRNKHVAHLTVILHLYCTHQVVEWIRILQYKGSAWVLAFGGTHAPGRASNSTCSIHYSIELKPLPHNT